MVHVHVALPFKGDGQYDVCVPSRGVWTCEDDSHVVCKDIYCVVDFIILPASVTYVP